MPAAIPLWNGAIEGRFNDLFLFGDSLNLTRHAAEAVHAPRDQSHGAHPRMP